MAAERIRCAVAGQAFTVTDQLALDITVSAGVSTNEGGLNDPLELLRQADAALYAAKKSGRNRVMSLAA